MRAGQAIQQAARLDAAAARPCTHCRHPMGDHFERPFGSPGYEAAVFHCRHDGCACTLDLTGSSKGEGA